MVLLRALNHIFTKSSTDDATPALYDAIVAQARRPDFYASMGVADTVDGRFDMLILHAILVMRRLRDHADDAQKLFDYMFADMDRSLREMGVGDMSIGKKIRPMMHAFYGRAQAYDGGLATQDDQLAAALAKNLYGAAYGKAGDAAHADAMANYVRQCAAALENQPAEAISAGQVAFPSPVAA